MSGESWRSLVRAVLTDKQFWLPLLILMLMEQAASGTAVPGSISQPGEAALVIVGHDTNQVQFVGHAGSQLESSRLPT